MQGNDATFITYLIIWENPSWNSQYYVLKITEYDNKTFDGCDAVGPEKSSMKTKNAHNFGYWKTRMLISFANKCWNP